jgi:hypothetical protein
MSRDTIIQLGLVIGVATFGSMFLTEAVVPRPHPTASAIALTLWLIVADLRGMCRRVAGDGQGTAGDSRCRRRR